MSLPVGDEPSAPALMGQARCRGEPQRVVRTRPPQRKPCRRTTKRKTKGSPNPGITLERKNLSVTPGGSQTHTLHAGHVVPIPDSRPRTSPSTRGRPPVGGNADQESVTHGTRRTDRRHEQDAPPERRKQLGIPGTYTYPKGVNPSRWFRQTEEGDHPRTMPNPTILLLAFALLVGRMTCSTFTSPVYPATLSR